MRCLWPTLICLALAGLAFQDVAAQSDPSGSTRSSRQRYQRDSGEEQVQGEAERASYSSQYGSDRTRTSRDYGQDRRNDFSGDDGNEDRPERRRIHSMDEIPPGLYDFDQDHNDAPHSSTRTDRRHRFDDVQAGFEDDDFASGSPASRRLQPASHLEGASHDYSQGLWSRALRSSRSGDTQGEHNERFASSADEFIRQHDQDEDNGLSRREMPRGMLEYFHDLDVDGDEHLSRSELQQHGQRMTQWLDQQTNSSANLPDVAAETRVIPVEVTYIWIMDADSGNVQLNDLQAAYELLRRLDGDSDGKITRDELQDRREQIASRWIDYGFERADSNADGVISREEANNTMLQERFDGLDRNGDEQLSRSELRRSSQNASRWWGPQSYETYLSEGPDSESRR